MSIEVKPVRSRRSIVVIGVALVLALAAGLAVERLGGQGEGGAPVDPFPRLLIALPVILAACYGVGRLFVLLRQPAVIGEIFAGVLLGPSFLGWIWPETYAYLFPAQVVSAINNLSQFGLVFFMFLVGHEVDLGLLKRRGLTVAVASQVNVAVPFACGIALGVAMYPEFAPSGIGLSVFALFLAVAFSITAFPVLARILADRKMMDSETGAMALFCAAVGDVAAWCMLAGVVAASRGQNLGQVGITAIQLAIFIGAMLLGVRPLLARLAAASDGSRRRVPEQAILPLLLAGLMLSALATDQIGVHPIFGAFLFGAIVPRKSSSFTAATDQIRGVTVALLLPLFLVYAGLHTDFQLLAGDGQVWVWCVLVTVVAVLSKAVSVSVSARLTGLKWHDSIALGALLNCRGLTELVVLNIGLQLGILNATVYAVMVIMTLVSTVITGPVLDLLNLLRRRRGDEPQPARPEELARQT
jgi:Kef-type K+ transport system membrane component KefB